MALETFIFVALIAHGKNGISTWSELCSLKGPKEFFFFSFFLLCGAFISMTIGTDDHLMKTFAKQLLYIFELPGTPDISGVPGLQRSIFGAVFWLSETL